MINTYNNRLFRILITIVCISILTISCKKEYVKFPYNDIEQFSLKDASGNALKASINGNEIIVYYTPFLPYPDFITPDIKVSNQATVNPASGIKVAFNEKTKYTVTAQDGSTKTYTLKPGINQPPLKLELNGGGPLITGEYFHLTGEFVVPDVNKTKLFLIDKDDKEIAIKIEDINISIISAIVPGINVAPKGTYYIKVVSGLRTLKLGPYQLQ